MGYLSDIRRMINDIEATPEALKADLDNRMVPHKSFAKGAMDGTLQFPCLISDSIPIDMASTIARTLERTYASFVQVYLSLNNTSAPFSNTVNFFFNSFTISNASSTKKSPL